MTNSRHPDIEIYVKNCSLEAIQDWLKSLSDQMTCNTSKNTIHEFTLTFQGNNVETLVHEKVAGKAWTSVWLKSDQTPWVNDLECARAAASAMDAQIRCVASGWEDGDDPDEYWKIENGTEEKIQWRT